MSLSVGSGCIVNGDGGGHCRRCWGSGWVVGGSGGMSAVVVSLMLVVVVVSIILIVQVRVTVSLMQGVGQW